MYISMVNNSYLYIYSHIHIHIYSHIFTCIHIFTYIHIYSHIFTYAYLHTYSKYAYSHIFTYQYIHIYSHIHIHICIFTYSPHGITCFQSITYKCTTSRHRVLQLSRHAKVCDLDMPRIREQNIAPFDITMNFMSRV